MSKQPANIRMDEIRAFAEQMLINRIFMGDYQEKRYVDKLKSYKDLIVVNRQEQILCDDLAKVRDQLRLERPNDWFGYTHPNDVGAPAVYCIWTTLESKEQVPSNVNEATVVFGEYWFQIKSLHFNANTIEIDVKILRPIDPTSSMCSGPSISSLAQQAMNMDTTKIQQYVQENIIDVDWFTLLNQWKISINQKAYRFLSTEITWNNFVYCVQLMGALSVTLFKLSVNFVHWLGEFTLRLVVELTKLVHTATPIALGIIGLLSKIIGGLYILFAMIWRDAFGGANQKNTMPQKSGISRPAIQYRQYQRPFPPDYRQSGSSRFHSK